MCLSSVAFSNRAPVQERGNTGLNHVMNFQKNNNRREEGRRERRRIQGKVYNDRPWNLSRKLEQEET